jgi:hypothetical protein
VNRHLATKIRFRHPNAADNFLPHQPEFFDPTHQQIIAATLQQIEGEEVKCRRDARRGDPSIATAHMRRNALRLLRPTRFKSGA